MAKFMELTDTNGNKMRLDLDAAMQVKGNSLGTELVYPFPLGRVQVKESYADIMRGIAALTK